METATLVSHSEHQIVTRENGIEVTRTCKVIVRHSNDCKRLDDSEYQKCNCSKSLLKYSSVKSDRPVNATASANWRESAHTRKWTEAQRQATDWLNSFHPDKAELRAKEQEIARLSGKSVRLPTVQVAVGLYIADMRFRQLAEKTISLAKTLLGDADPNTGEVKHVGKFFPWLDSQNLPQPVRISDITPEMLTRWRSTWRVADSTKVTQHGKMKEFFNFSKQQGWLGSRPSPAADIKCPRIKKGNRTAIFSDAQYKAITKAAASDPRLLAFIELARWSGMASIDATLFKLGSIDSENVLRYKRVKTGKLAVVTLPNRVVELLSNVPLIEGAAKEQPFRYPGMTLKSNRDRWWREFRDLCEPIELGEIKTEIGRVRNPHLHMLRDTAAVWYLRHGLGVHEVAKVLGDTVAMVEKHYLPFVKELEDAHIQKTKAILAAAGAD